MSISHFSSPGEFSEYKLVGMYIGFIITLGHSVMFLRDCLHMVGANEYFVKVFKKGSMILTLLYVYCMSMHACLSFLLN